MSLVGNPLKQLWSAYERQLERRPILTQMTTSAVLWGVGDGLAQRLEYWDLQNDRRDKSAAAAAAASKTKPVKGVHPKAAQSTETGSSSNPQMVIDWKRAVVTGMFGALLVGPVGHYWYITLDRWCNTIVPGGGPIFIAAKVAIDTAAMGPFYVSAFFAWGCAFLDGSSWNGFKRKMQVDFWPTLAAEASAWPLIQAVNFSVVPLKHQLLVVNLMTVLDACFMSWARSQDDWLAKAKELLKASSRRNGQQDSQGTLSVLPLAAESSRKQQ